MEQDNVIGEWQLCPKCLGNGFIHEPLPTKSTSPIKQCDVCFGNKILAKPQLEFLSRIQSLEAANAFHKQAAHEAIQEQYRLQKENEVLKEKVDELTMADMTHEYNEAEGEKFRPHFEEQMCVGFVEWVNEYYCYSYEEKFWASLDDLLIEERLTTEELYKLYKSKS